MQDLVYPAERVHHRRQEVDAGETVVRRNDPVVCIRTASADDKEGMRRMLSRLSLETIYRRFHAPYPRVPEWVTTFFAEVDRPRKEAVVTAVGDEIVGHAMYVRSEDGRDAEFAVLVEDGWQSKGVGKLLLSELAERARCWGIETFTGIVLGENRRVPGLLDAVFAGVGYQARGGLYHVRVPLRSPEPVDELFLMPAPALAANTSGQMTDGR